MKVFSPDSSPRGIMCGARVGNLYKVAITHSTTRTTPRQFAFFLADPLRDTGAHLEELLHILGAMGCQVRPTSGTARRPR